MNRAEFPFADAAQAQNSDALAKATSRLGREGMPWVSQANWRGQISVVQSC